MINFSVSRISEKRVFPANITSEQSSKDGKHVTLSLADEKSIPHNRGTVVWFFDNVSESQATAAVANLEAALSRTLSSYPQLCGSLVKGDGTGSSVKGRYTIRYSTPEDQGASFEVSYCNQAVRDLVPSRRSKGGTEPPDWNFGQHIKGAQFAPITSSGDADESSPLLRVRITTCHTDGLVIALDLYHAIGDAYSLTQFVRAWAAQARLGPEASIPQPVWGAEHVDKFAGDIGQPQPDPRLMELANRLPMSKYDSSETLNQTPTDESFGLSRHLFSCMLKHANVTPLFAAPWADWNPAAPVVRRVFHFDKTAIAALQDIASSQGIPSLSRPRLLMAHVWQSMNRARLLDKDEDQVYLHYPVNMRSRVQPTLPTTLMGSPFLVSEVARQGNTLSLSKLAHIAAAMSDVTSEFTTESMGAELHASAFDESSGAVANAFFGPRRCVCDVALRDGYNP